MNNIFRRIIIQIIIIVSILTLFFYVGRSIYRVLSISSTFPPIKKYEYSGTTNQFFSGLENYSYKHHNVIIKMTDTTGTKENGFGYYLDMVINNVPDTVIYNLKFEKDDDDGKTHRTTVEIIGAFTKKMTYN